MTLPLRSLTTEDGCRELDVLDTQDYWSITASRGGGASKHDVWRIDSDPSYRAFAGKVELLLRCKHVSDTDLKQLNTVAREFFQSCERAGCFYGRGDFTSTVHHFLLGASPAPLGLIAVAWTRSEARSKPIVPGVYRFNYLDASRRSLLDMAFFKKGIEDGMFAIDTRETEQGLLITAGEIDFASVMDDRPNKSTLSYKTYELCEEEFLWLLHHFAKANMLAVQNLEWQAKYPMECKRRREESQAREAREKRERRANRSKRRTLAPRVVKVPRCLGNAASHAPNAKLPPELDGHLRAQHTPFAITGPDARKGVTLYGGASQHDDLVHSPIRAGSLKTDRALFEFDELCHGWDGEHREGEFRAPDRTMMQFKCPTCDGRHFQLHAVCEYPTDLDELDDDKKDRAEDFFTWFWVHAGCTGCQWSGIAASIECA